MGFGESGDGEPGAGEEWRDVVTGMLVYQDAGSRCEVLPYALEFATAARGLPFEASR